MVLLKCAKCGAEITEEQLTCSACGFVNDIEVCKKLAGQEEIALQEKAEREREEKRAEKELKLTKDQEALYACIKKANLPFMLLNILGAMVLLFGFIGLIGEAASLASNAGRMGFYGEFADAYITAGLMVVKGQGIGICFMLGLAINIVTTNLSKFFMYNALSKKMDEINFDGNEWLKEFQKTKCVNGITLEKALKKQMRNYWIANVICDKNNPELKITKNKKLNHLLTAILSGFANAFLGYIFVDIIAWIGFGARFNTTAIVCLVMSIAFFIATIIAGSVVDGKTPKIVSEELKKFDVQSEQPTQPEQNA